MKKLLVLIILFTSIQMYSQEAEPIYMYNTHTMFMYSDSTLGQDGLNISERLKVIPSFEKIILLKELKNQYRISHNNQTGYILKIKSGNILVAEKEFQLNKEFKEIREAELVAKYDSHYGNLLFKEEISIGMTKEMIKDLLGNPTKIRTSATYRGTEENWLYGDILESYINLQFIDGELVSFQSEQSTH